MAPRARKDLGTKMKHGTCSTYNRGCRCTECRAAAAAYQLRWRKANPEKERERQRRDRKAHPEKVRARDRERPYRRETNRRRIGFTPTKKIIYLGFNPRTGICSVCGRVRHDGERQFDLHHLLQVEGDPKCLLFVQEVCQKHHRQITTVQKRFGPVPTIRTDEIPEALRLLHE